MKKYKKNKHILLVIVDIFLHLGIHSEPMFLSKLSNFFWMSIQSVSLIWHLMMDVTEYKTSMCLSRIILRSVFRISASSGKSHRVPFLSVRCIYDTLICSPSLPPATTVPRNQLSWFSSSSCQTHTTCSPYSKSGILILSGTSRTTLDDLAMTPFNPVNILRKSPIVRFDTLLDWFKNWHKFAAYSVLSRFLCCLLKRNTEASFLSVLLEFRWNRTSRYSFSFFPCNLVHFS